MTATTLRSTQQAQSLTQRLWNSFSAFLMKIANANARNRSVEPFGL